MPLTSPKKLCTDPSDINDYEKCIAKVQQVFEEMPDDAFKGAFDSIVDRLKCVVATDGRPIKMTYEGRLAVRQATIAHFDNSKDALFQKARNCRKRATKRWLNMYYPQVMHVQPALQ